MNVHFCTVVPPTPLGTVIPLNRWCMVQPVKVTQDSLYTEPVPSHTTLDMSRLGTEFELEAPGVEQTLRECFLYLAEPGRANSLELVAKER